MIVKDMMNLYFSVISRKTATLNMSATLKKILNFYRLSNFPPNLAKITTFCTDLEINFSERYNLCTHKFVFLKTKLLTYKYNIEV